MYSLASVVMCKLTCLGTSLTSTHFPALTLICYALRPSFLSSQVGYDQRLDGKDFGGRCEAREVRGIVESRAWVFDVVVVDDLEEARGGGSAERQRVVELVLLLPSLISLLLMNQGLGEEG